MSQFLRRLDTAECPFSISNLTQRPSGVRPAQLLPQNGHATGNTALRPWHLELLRHLSLPHRPTNQQVRLFQEPMALWQARCTNSVLTDPPLGQVDDELVQIFSSLPDLSLLGVWHNSMRKLATFDRKDMLIALPPVLSLGSKLSRQRGFWSDAAAAMRAVHERWP